MYNNLPIGIYDSGIGGLTVYKKLRKMLPGENIIYFGDTYRAPYGSRSKEQICQFVDEIMRFMSLCSVKFGVVACNSITVLGIDAISQNYNFDLIGNSTGAQSALVATKNKRIGIIATETTVSSGFHHAAIASIDKSVKVFAQPCPKLAPLIELGNLQSSELCEAVVEYLTPLKELDVDTVILACTHYPYISHLVQEFMGEKVTIIDPAEETAQKAYNFLACKQGLNENNLGTSRFYFSGNPERAKTIASNLFDTSSLKFEMLDLSLLSFYCSRYSINGANMLKQAASV